MTKLFRWFKTSLLLRNQIIAFFLCAFLALTATLPAFETALRSEGRLYYQATGDQSFYLWAIERAEHSSSYSEFIHQCDWNQAGCIHLQFMPHEWRSFYFFGRAGAYFHLSSEDIVKITHLAHLTLNTISGSALVTAITGVPLLAAPLGLLVGMHPSILGRLGGHFPLVGIWPLFLFASICVGLGIIAAKESDRKKTQWLALTWTAAIGAFHLVAFFSFYYLMFAAVVAPFFFLIGVWTGGRDLKTAWKNWKNTVLSRNFLLFFALTSLIGIGILYRSFGYVILGQDGIKNSETANRSISDVRLYSANIMDYFNEGLRRAWSALGLPGGNKIFATSNRGEGVSYMGDTLMFLCFMTLFLRIKRARRLNHLERSWFFGALLIGFWSTQWGGLVVHALISSARCFARLTPLVMLTLAVSIGLVLKEWISSLKNPRATGVLVCALISISAVHEISQSGHLQGIRQMNLSDDPNYTLTWNKLREHCKNHPKAWVELNPAVNDVLAGPYMLYFLAENSGCRLFPIKTPGISLPPNKTPETGKSAISVNWDDRNYTLPLYSVELLTDFSPTMPSTLDL